VPETEDSAPENNQRTSSPYTDVYSPKQPSPRRKTKTRSNSKTSEREELPGICSEFFFMGACSNQTKKAAITTVKKKHQQHSFLDILQNQGCSCGRHPQSINMDYALASKVHSFSFVKTEAGEDESFISGASANRSESTLYQALSSQRNRNYEQHQQNCSTIFHSQETTALEASRSAAEAAYNAKCGDIKNADDPSWRSTMNPLSHLGCILSCRHASERHRKVSEMVVSMLTDSKITVGSIMYVLVEGILIFDRNRSGLVVSPADEEWLLHGDQGSKRRSISIGQDPKAVCHSSVTTVEEYHRSLVTFLPAPVLEYFILFLEDETAGKLPLVCKNWHQEIGKKSPHIWKQLCHRNQWPISGELVGPECFREIFISHYTASAMLKSMACVLKSVSKSTPYEKSRHIAATSDLKGGDLVSAWSPNRVLVGNKVECALDLYEAVDSKTSTACRRLKRVIHQVVPSRSKRRHELVHLVMDDDYIGCICQDLGDEHFHLHSIPKAALLECAGCYTPHELNEIDISVFDLSNLIENYVCEHLFDEVLESTVVQILTYCRVSSVSECFACKNGLFFLGTTLRLGVIEDFDLSSNINDVFVTKFFLFSAISGSVMWSNNQLTTSTSGFECRVNQCPTNETSVTSMVVLYYPLLSLFQEIRIERDGTVLLEEQVHKLPVVNPGNECKVILGFDHTVIAHTYSNKTVLSFPGDSNSVEIEGTLRSFAVRRGIYVVLMVSNEEDDVTSLKLFHMHSRAIIAESKTGSLSESIIFSSGESSMAALVEEKCAFVMSEMGAEGFQNTTASFAKEQGKYAKRKKKTSKRRSNSGVDGYARGMRMN
jgi:hypothetical protein